MAGQSVRRHAPESWHPFSVVGVEEGEGNGRRVAFVMKDMGAYPLFLVKREGAA